jgi:anti-anti-sigma regulatory factor
MTLKIEKVSDGGKTVIRLSGRLRSEYLDELKTQIDGDQSRIALDLDGVTLVECGGYLISEWLRGEWR